MPDRDTVMRYDEIWKLDRAMSVSRLRGSYLASKKLSDEVLAWLTVRSEMRMICIWSS